jgi:hypothetical protein
MGAPKIGNFSRCRAPVVSMDIEPSNSQIRSRVDDSAAAFGLPGVRALVLVGGRPDVERFGEFPLSLLDVLGRSLLLRTLDRMRAAGVGEIAVISDTVPLPPSPALASCKFGVVSPESFWGEAVQEFRRLSRQSECVLVVRLGAWAEVDFAAMVRDHCCSESAIMRACPQDGDALDVFVISSSSQAEAAALLRGELRDERITAAEHKTYGYVNMLRTPADLRTLSLDAFAGETAIHPFGHELRPGVWIGKGARVHRCARVIAPTFIGAFCNVRRDAVVTRGSSLEHHSEVDCGTVIDNSSVMAYTRVGAGLDVEHSVVGFQQVHSLQRKATVDIEDPQLIGATTTHFFARMFPVVSGLFNFLPDAMWRLVFEPRPETMQVGSEALMPSAPALSDAPLATVDPQTKSYSEMAATRRYGNE